MLFKYSLHFHQFFLVSNRFVHSFLVERWGRVWFSILAISVALYDCLTFFVQLTGWTTSLIGLGSHSLGRVLRNIKAYSRFLWSLRFISFHVLDFFHWRFFNLINWDSSYLNFLELLPSFGLLEFYRSKLSYGFITLHQSWICFLHLMYYLLLSSRLFEQFIFVRHEALRFLSLPLIFKGVKTVQKWWIYYLFLHTLILVFEIYIMVQFRWGWTYGSE
jgi:hypothetical protein